MHELNGLSLRTSALATLCGCLLVAAGTVRAAEIRSGNAVLTVSPQETGVVNAVRFRGREVVPQRTDFVGASIRLAAADSTRSNSLFPHRIACTLPAKTAKITPTPEGVMVCGSYADGGLELPFSRRIETGPGDNEFTIEEEVDFRRMDAEYLLASHVLELPLQVSDDEHVRMFAFGGERRVEMFRMDMNDESRRNQLISDNRAFWPYWDIGGLLQLPGAYRIWRANHADTMAYPIEDGCNAPGWADYSELDWGITVRVAAPQKAAPWALEIDARRGVLSVLVFPPSAIPRAGKDAGKRVFRFILTFHDTSWPAAHACELDVERYKELLRFLNRGDRFTHLDFVLRSIGLVANEGPKTQEQMEEVCQRVILKERVQPSLLLRLLYRGDAWRMQGLVREILNQQVPRNMPLARWEEVARKCLERFRKGSERQPPGDG